MVKTIATPVVKELSAAEALALSKYSAKKGLREEVALGTHEVEFAVLCKGTITIAPPVEVEAGVQVADYRRLLAAAASKLKRGTTLEDLVALATAEGDLDETAVEKMTEAVKATKGKVEKAGAVHAALEWDKL